MTLATILRICLLGLFLIVLFLSPLSAENGSVNLTLGTIIYIISLLLLSYARLARVRPLVIYFFFLSIFWCVLRLVFLNASVDSVNYQYLVAFDPDAMAVSVVMLTLSSIALVGGMAAGSTLRAPQMSVHVPVLGAAVNLTFLSGYLLCLLGWLLFDNLAFRTDDYSKLLGIINMALSLDTIILLATAVCIYRYDITSKQRLALFSLLLGYVILRTLAGSKSGLFLIAISALATLLATNYQYRFKSTNIGKAALLVVAALVLFVLGTETRSISVDMTSKGTFSYGGLITDLSHKYDEVIDSFDGMYWLETVSRRLSMYDYLHVMFSGDPVTSHLGLVYGLKSIWNVVAPSIISFDEANLFQANLFKVAYGHGTFEQAVGNYHTDMLPLFGALYVNFGWFWMIPTAFFGYASARIFVCIDCLSLKERYFFRTLLIYFFGDFLFGMGIGATIQQILFYAALPLVTLFISQRIFFGLLRQRHGRRFSARGTTD